MVTEFPPADVPASSNVHGTPAPPSGLHGSVSPGAVITPSGGWGGFAPPVVVGAGSNVHGTPEPPSGTHSALGRAAAFVSRLLGLG